MSGCYLETAAKSDCSGCGACQAVCPVGAISMRQDEEGFFYPHTDKEVCINCDKCFRTCPLPVADQLKHKESQEVYGGWHLDDEVLAESTSGGIFSALCRAFGGQGRVYGACTKGKGQACHSFVEGQMPHGKEFRASKYTQSMAGNTFQEIRQQLKEGKKVKRHDNVALLRTFSKLFSLAACRLGVITASEKVIEQVKKSKLTFDVNSIALLFGEKLLDHPEIEQKLIAAEKEGKAYFLEAMRSKGYECRECKGNFVLVKTGIEPQKLAKRLEEKKVLIKTFSKGLLKGYIRVSTGSKKAMEKFVEILTEVTE